MANCQRFLLVNVTIKLPNRSLLSMGLNLQKYNYENSVIWMRGLVMRDSTKRRDLKGSVDYFKTGSHPSTDYDDT